MNKQITIISMIALSISIAGCEKDTDLTEPTAQVEQDFTPYTIDFKNFPDPNLPADNPLTQAGFDLGKQLFYDPILSRDNSISCASCHNQSSAFDDNNRFSIGVDGQKGSRQAMAIFNMAWNSNGFFWDGRAELLRHQAVLPIQDELEMDETIDNVVAKLSEMDEYKNRFIKAFGSPIIDEKSISLALEQFMLTLVSNQSKYDDYLAGKTQLSASEERGRKLYFTEYNQFIPDSSGADCAHCHGGINFENDRYMNNGLDQVITDKGFGAVSGRARDEGKFKVVSLRNIALTAPYMHDGRFQTLEEVVEHYNSGIQRSATLDPAIEMTMSTGLRLTDQDKKDLVAFLKTLTDEKFITNSKFSKP